MNTEPYWKERAFLELRFDNLVEFKNIVLQRNLDLYSDQTFLDFIINNYQKSHKKDQLKKLLEDFPPSKKALSHYDFYNNASLIFKNKCSPLLNILVKEVPNFPNFFFNNDNECEQYLINFLKVDKKETLDDDFFKAILNITSHKFALNCLYKIKLNSLQLAMIEEKVFNEKTQLNSEKYLKAVLDLDENNFTIKIQFKDEVYTSKKIDGEEKSILAKFILLQLQKQIENKDYHLRDQFILNNKFLQYLINKAPNHMFENLPQNQLIYINIFKHIGYEKDGFERNFKILAQIANPELLEKVYLLLTEKKTKLFSVEQKSFMENYFLNSQTSQDQLRRKLIMKL